MYPSSLFIVYQQVPTPKIHTTMKTFVTSIDIVSKVSPYFIVRGTNMLTPRNYNMWMDWDNLNRTKDISLFYQQCEMIFQ